MKYVQNYHVSETACYSCHSFVGCELERPQLRNIRQRAYLGTSICTVHWWLLCSDVHVYGYNYCNRNYLHKLWLRWTWTLEVMAWNKVIEAFGGKTTLVCLAAQYRHFTSEPITGSLLNFRTLNLFPIISCR